MISPTLSLTLGDIGSIPVLSLTTDGLSYVAKFAKESVGLSKADWNSFETSWDFKRHPLV